MKTISFFLFTFLTLPFLLIGQRKWTAGGKLKPEQAIVDIRHYTLTMAVEPSTKSIRGKAVIDFVLSESSSVLLFDLINLYTVEKVLVNDKEQAFKHEKDIIRIELADPLFPGNAAVTVEYAGKPPEATKPPWLGGIQWAKDSTGKDWIAMTCQHEGPKIFFPTKDHTSDEPNEGVDMFITVPKGLVVAGPGLLQSVVNKHNESTYHWKTNYTINSYNIVFNVANYKVVTRPYTTIEGNKVPMEFYVLEQHANKAAYHLSLLERSVKMLEKYFGEYPFSKEKIAIAETPHRGMEHQTMNAYGNGFQYVKKGGFDFDELMHHEFAHEWWGNKVTAKNLEDFWIQEGICTFADLLMTRELQGEQAYRNILKNYARNLPNRKPVVAAKDATASEAYSGEIYIKGGFFMHTLRYVVGDSVFFPALKKLATDPIYTYDNLITTDDIQQLFSSASNKQLEPLFTLFLRTNKPLQISLKRVRSGEYLVRLLNIDMSLPLEVVTSSGVQTITTRKDGNLIKSKTIPVIDPNVFYIRKIVVE